uniref:Uncharacterized protein n=1 Tax=Rhizophora mucronata TaxID=61149 RepID=A0A2P2P575_RHIMU
MHMLLNFSVAHIVFFLYLSYPFLLSCLLVQNLRNHQQKIPASTLESIYPPP